MKTFTGFEYLLIDLANTNWLGGDKWTFEERIQWSLDNFNQLEALAGARNWKQRPLFVKATLALRKAQQGIPTGHRIGLDAVCSGLQIMSALTGCYSGAKATGLVDPDTRADAYTICNSIMSELLGYEIPHQRDKLKNAVMTSLYGSEAEPKKEFGEDTPELNAFQKAMMEMAPGACELLNDLLHSWQPYAPSHDWTLPDGFEARVKVMVKQEKRVEVDELNHSSFTYVYYENEGTEWDRKNAANVIHSIDAYVLRSLLRRCSHNTLEVVTAINLITGELLSRELDSWAPPIEPVLPDYPEVQGALIRWTQTFIADLAVLPHLTSETVALLPSEYLTALVSVLDTMDHKPFPVVTVHDDFTAHPNNLNHLRKHYRNILAELADSTLLDHILNQLHGTTGGVFHKKSDNLSSYIRQSNYALC